VYFVKDGNQMAKEPSVNLFRTLEVPDDDPYRVGHVSGGELLLGAIELGGTRTDIQPAGCFIAGGTRTICARRSARASGLAKGRDSTNRAPPRFLISRLACLSVRRVQLASATL